MCGLKFVNINTNVNINTRIGYSVHFSNFTTDLRISAAVLLGCVKKEHYKIVHFNFVIIQAVKKVFVRRKYKLFYSIVSRAITILCFHKKLVGYT